MAIGKLRLENVKVPLLACGHSWASGAPVMRRVAMPVLALALLVGAACSPPGGGTPPPRQGEEIVVGVPMAATGDEAPEGQLSRQGYDLWAAWANRGGGVPVGGVRHRVRLLYEDDASRAAQSAQVAERMVTMEHATFLLGPYGTTNTAAVAAVADRHHVPMIAANGAARQIYMQGYRYVFGILAPAELYAAAVLDLALLEKPPPTTVALLTADDIVSLSIAKGASDYAISKGLKVVYFQQYPAGTTNLYPLVQQAKAKNPDVFVNSGHLLEAIAAHKAAKDLRLDAKMFAYSVGPTEPQFVQALGPAAEDVVTSSPWDAEARYHPSYYLSSAQYVAAYRARYGGQQPPPYVVADSTAAGLALELGLEHAGSLDPARVRDAIAALDMTTFFGRIKFDAQGQNTFRNILVEQIQMGSIQTIYPPEVATASPMYPAPTWEARFGVPAPPPRAKLPGTGRLPVLQ